MHPAVAIFPGALGDLLLALPALRALRARHRVAALTLVVSEPLRALARLAAVADRVESLDGPGTAWLFGAGRRPAWLAGRPAVYAWIGSRDPGVAARLGAVASHVELFAVERGDGPLHAAVAYARGVGLAACEPADLAPAARLAVPTTPAAEAVRARGAGPLLALHRGAGASAKRWSRAAFEIVARRWCESGGAVIDLLGPAEADEAALAEALPVRCWPLPDVAALLAAATAYVGCDSGVSHLAGAAGARGAVVFGPTQPRRWHPLSPLLVPLGPARDGVAVRADEVLALLGGMPSLTSQEADTIDPQ